MISDLMNFDIFFWNCPENSGFYRFRKFFMLENGKAFHFKTKLLNILKLRPGESGNPLLRRLRRRNKDWEL